MKKEREGERGPIKDNAFPSLAPTASTLMLFSLAFPRPRFHHNGDISSPWQNSIDTAESIARATYTHFDNGSDASAVTTDRNKIFDCNTASTHFRVLLSNEIYVERNINFFSFCKEKYFI